MRTARTLSAIAALAAALAIFAASASATVKLGQVATSPTGGCSGNVDVSQKQVSSGTPYASTVNGTVTSWSTSAGDAAGAQWTLKVLHPTGAANEYTVTGLDGPEVLTAGHVVSKFSASVPIKIGDLIGAYIGTAGTDCIQATVNSTDLRYFRLGSNLLVGQPGVFSTSSNSRTNLAAEIEPTNSLKLAKPKLNKKKGSATVKVTVENAGVLQLAGGGAKPILLKKVAAPGSVKLKIAASGKKKKTLNDSGKVGIKTTVTFTPTGGKSKQQKVKVKLKKQ